MSGDCHLSLNKRFYIREGIVNSKEMNSTGVLSDDGTTSKRVIAKNKGGLL